MSGAKASPFSSVFSDMGSESGLTVSKVPSAISCRVSEASGTGWLVHAPEPGSPRYATFRRLMANGFFAIHDSWSSKAPSTVSFWKSPCAGIVRSYQYFPAFHWDHPKSFGVKSGPGLLPMALTVPSLSHETLEVTASGSALQWSVLMMRTVSGPSSYSMAMAS